MFVGDGSAWRSQSGPVLNAGSRYHLVATYDGTNARLYVNGALVSTGPNATMAANGGANVMRFGDFSTGPGQYWPGTLDDASFYPAVLSASQVQAHYNASITGSLATSAATAVVTTVAPVNTSPPTMSGPAQQGQTLTADPGSWSGTAPISYTYQWQRCSPGCANISGATASSYPVLAADVGATLRVAVTGTNSAAPARHPHPNRHRHQQRDRARQHDPAVGVGHAQQGQTLTPTTGSWSGTAPISYTYQWQRCSPGCSDISGATASSYRCSPPMSAPPSASPSRAATRLVGDCFLGSDGCGQWFRGDAAGEYVAAFDFGGGAVGADADGDCGELVGDGTDLLQLSVAAL